jgi:acyl-CoA hydrolase
MVIGVQVEAEDLLTGDVRHTTSCLLTFVAIGKKSRCGRPRSSAGSKTGVESGFVAGSQITGYL